MADKINLIQSSKVKARLRGNGFQIKAEVYNDIDNFLAKSLDKLISGAKSENIKSIGTDDVFRILGVPKKEASVDEKVDVLANKTKGCSRCGGIKDNFVKYGRDLQAVVSDEAQRLLNRSGLD